MVPPYALVVLGITLWMLLMLGIAALVCNSSNWPRIRAFIYLVLALLCGVLSWLIYAPGPYDGPQRYWQLLLGLGTVLFGIGFAVNADTN